MDVGWGLGFISVAWLALIIGGGDPARRWLFAILVTVWAARLSVHMHVKSRGKGEDPRYVALMAKYEGPPVRVAARRIFATQGAAQWFVSLPIQVSAAVSSSGSGLAAVVIVAGSVMWATGFAFEAVGDAQLRRFKATAAKGQIMDRGLWAWTRHPNYFGDALLWWGLWLIAASTWPGVLTVLSPVAMSYFLVVGTGARLLEMSMSERPSYREYQEQTSFFFPRPPRRSGRGIRSKR